MQLTGEVLCRLRCLKKLSKLTHRLGVFSDQLSPQDERDHLYDYQALRLLCHNACTQTSSVTSPEVAAAVAAAAFTSASKRLSFSEAAVKAARLDALGAAAACSHVRAAPVAAAHASTGHVPELCASAPAAKLHASGLGAQVPSAAAAGSAPSRSSTVPLSASTAAAAAAQPAESLSSASEHTRVLLRDISNLFEADRRLALGVNKSVKQAQQPNRPSVLQANMARQQSSVKQVDSYSKAAHPTAGKQALVPHVGSQQRSVSQTDYDSKALLRGVTDLFEADRLFALTASTPSSRAKPFVKLPVVHVTIASVHSKASSRAKSVQLAIETRQPAKAQTAAHEIATAETPDSAAAEAMQSPRSDKLPSLMSSKSAASTADPEVTTAHEPQPGAYQGYVGVNYHPGIKDLDAVPNALGYTLKDYQAVFGDGFVYGVVPWEGGYIPKNKQKAFQQLHGERVRRLQELHKIEQDIRNLMD